MSRKSGYKPRPRKSNRRSPDKGKIWDVLERLRQGPATNVELNAIMPYSKKRISDLRNKFGFKIKTEIVYTLVQEPQCSTVAFS